MEKTREFVLTSDRFNGELRYCFRGEMLTCIDASECTGLNAQIFRTAPLTLAETLEQLKKSTSHPLFVEVTTEIPFEEFWKKYNNKLGNKKRTERKWNSMPKAERVKAFRFIDKYVAMLNNGVEMKYPETYLNSEIWNN